MFGGIFFRQPCNNMDTPFGRIVGRNFSFSTAKKKKEKEKEKEKEKKKGTERWKIIINLIHYCFFLPNSMENLLIWSEFSHDRHALKPAQCWVFSTLSHPEYTQNIQSIARYPRSAGSRTHLVHCVLEAETKIERKKNTSAKPRMIIR
jgi:hypothetical protein